MSVHRVIPVVLLRGGRAVLSRRFRRWPVLGDPLVIVERLSAWASDELVYLDVTPPGGAHDAGRADLGGARWGTPDELLREVGRRAFMPLAFGGGIRTEDDVERRFAAGADKVVIRGAALREPDFVGRIAAIHGAQAVVACVDCRRHEAAGAPSRWSAHGGAGDPPRDDAIAWIRELADRGAGEILVQSMDRDGRGGGYDLELVAAAAAAVAVPVIALGGVGSAGHLADGLRAGADAVAAANFFNYSEQSVHRAKQALHEAGFAVRPPGVDGSLAPSTAATREPAEIAGTGRR